MVRSVVLDGIGFGCIAVVAGSKFAVAVVVGLVGVAGIAFRFAVRLVVGSIVAAFVGVGGMLVVVGAAAGFGIVVGSWLCLLLCSAQCCVVRSWCGAAFVVLGRGAHLEW